MKQRQADRKAWQTVILRLQVCRSNYFYNKYQPYNTQPSASAVPPAFLSLQRKFCTAPGWLHQQPTTFYHPQDFRTGDFKRLFLANRNGTSAYPDAEAGGLGVVRGGTQVVWLGPCPASGKPQSEAKTCKRNSTLSCSSSRWEAAQALIFFLFLCNIRSGATISTYEREREGRNCLCFLPFFVRIWLDHPQQSDPCHSCGLVASIFHIFLLVLCPCSLALRKVSFPQFPATGYSSAAKPSGQMKKGKIRRRGWPRLLLGVPFSPGFSSSSGSLSKPE